jgi:FtsP/CotA-like multicopper oxidase with cupredoxin domain
MKLSRRDIIKLGAVGTVGLALPFGKGISAKTASSLADSQMPVPFKQQFIRPMVLQPKQSYTGELAPGAPMYEVTQQAGSVTWVRNGKPTTVFGYNGTAPGPTVSIESSLDIDDTSKQIVMRQRNSLPAINPLSGHEFNTSTHLHGSASLPQYDGYASDVTAPGQFKDYIYPNFQEARTLWYHDHGVHHTAQNAYSGLAAQYHLHDPRERQILPQGEFDVPLTLGDVMLDANGNVAYDDHSLTYLMGDIILVNGVPWPNMKVKKRIYRFRILAASISRSYRPALSTNDLMHIVATDAGLMPKTVAVKNYRHGGAERYEVLIDFSKYAAGTKIQLRNLSNDNNIDYDNTNKIMQFEVTDDPFDKSDPTWNTIPATPNPDNPIMLLNPADAVRTRKFAVDRSAGIWQFGEHSWEDVIEDDYEFTLANPKLNDVEIWEIENRSGGWFHPVHIHLVDFQILSRNGAAPFAWEKGPKDVVYVGEGETVRLLMKFEHRQGRYMIHCHNLVHEDHDMMGQFLVGTDSPAVDPINAAPAKPQSEEF